MRSLAGPQLSVRYLGVDLTDRYSARPRPIDVCGLQLDGTGRLLAQFWQWTWPAHGPLDVSQLLPEVRRAKSVMVDGPQGLARLERTLRVSERALAAAGKTASTRPPLSQPFGGYICSSLDLFASFREAGLGVDQSSHLVEVYPAAFWTRLVTGLPNKKSLAGREARIASLTAVGVNLPTSLPTHDQLDACAAALVGAAADNLLPGLSVVQMGEEVFWDAATRCLREGTIHVPTVDSGTGTLADPVIAVDR